MARSRTLSRVLFAGALAAATSGGLTPPAATAETVGPAYRAEQLKDAAGTPYTCGVWSGGSDGEANMYLPCNNAVVVLNQTGGLIASVPVTEPSALTRDAAASFDGSFVYYTVARIDDLGPSPAPGIGSVHRLVRGADGTYRQDTSFAVGPFAMQSWNGVRYWGARNLSVDRAGNLYVTSNAFVYVYNSSGQRLAQMGGDAQFDQQGGYIGGLEVAQGIEVTPDGQHVYVVEQRRNHIQRWDRTATGAWVRSGFRIGDPHRASDCVQANLFAAPYDISLDGAGNIYVLDATCRRVVRFGGDGAFSQLIWQNYHDGAPLYHGVAVDFRGNVVVAEQGRRYAHTGTLGSCAPDWDAPTVTLSLAPRVHATTVTAPVAAADACSSVNEMKISGDTTGPAQWAPFSARPTVQLTGGDGPKHLTVTVRDAWGRTASASAATQLDTSRPRVRGSIRLPGQRRFCHPRPLRMLGNSASFRLKDRCATVTGKLSRIKRRGKSVTLELRLTAREASKLYTNVRGPMMLRVFGSTRTSTGRPLRRKRMTTVSGALLGDPAATTVLLAPAARWSRR